MALFIEFMASLGFTIFCSYAAYLSYTVGMQWIHMKNFMVGPGIFPLVISSVLTLLSISWSVSLIKKQGMRKIFAGAKEYKEFLVRNLEYTRQFVLIMGSTVLYLYILIPYLGFFTATVIYLVPVTSYFGKIKVWFSVILAFSITIFVHLIFGKMLGMPLP